MDQNKTMKERLKKQKKKAFYVSKYLQGNSKI